MGSVANHTGATPFRVEYISPFIKSLTNAFQTMLECKPRRGEICLSHERVLKHPVSGVIGLQLKQRGSPLRDSRRNPAAACLDRSCH
jgi:CheY-specific phosphatase CheX